MKQYTYEIDKNRKIELNRTNGIQIKEFQIDDKGNYKDYIMVYEWDYGFSAYTEENNVSEVTFSFDYEHPLYFPLLHFLKDDKEIKIASDFKRAEYDDLCYFKISKDKDLIYLSFVNKIEKEQHDIEKFEYTIKNVAYDLRSKLDMKNTDIKERLCKFFRETVLLFTEENHQISIEEYMISKNKIKSRNKNN